MISYNSACAGIAQNTPLIIAEKKTKKKTSKVLIIVEIIVLSMIMI